MIDQIIENQIVAMGERIKALEGVIKAQGESIKAQGDAQDRMCERLDNVEARCLLRF